MKGKETRLNASEEDGKKIEEDAARRVKKMQREG